MLQRLRSRLHGEGGFTLIELLVVILIIGILAAIAIPSFLNQKSKATDSNAIESARTAQTAMESYYTDNNSYASADAAALKGIESSLKNASGLAVTGSGGTGTPSTGYRVTVTGGDSRTFSVDKAADGTITHPCFVPTTASNNGSCTAVDPTTHVGHWSGVSS